jgi:hypothetical protein
MIKNLEGGSRGLFKILYLNSPIDIEGCDKPHSGETVTQAENGLLRPSS